MFPWAFAHTDLLAQYWVRRILYVLLVWAFAFVLTRLAKRVFDRVDQRLTRMGEPARALLKLDWAVSFFVFGIAVFVSLSLLGVGQAIWGAVALTSVAGVIVGLAAQQLGQNLIAGMVILVDRPYKVGHFVQVADQRGTVRKVNLYATTLGSVEGPVIMIPNSKVMDAPVTNFSVIEARRITVRIDVTVTKDLERAMDVMREAIRADEPHLVPGREVTVFAKETLDNGVLFECWYWIDPGFFIPHCLMTSKSRLIEALHRAGYTTSTPTTVIRFNETPPIEIRPSGDDGAGGDA